jgi:hypothetical protein
MDTLAAAAPPTASARWSGHWIGHKPRAATGSPADFLTGGEADRKFSRSMFRRTFDLEMVPADAPARVTADSRYVLWVNGQEVGRGPARSQPYRHRHDSSDRLGPRARDGRRGALISPSSTKDHDRGLCRLGCTRFNLRSPQQYCCRMPISESGEFAPSPPAGGAR